MNELKNIYNQIFIIKKRKRKILYRQNSIDVNLTVKGYQFFG